MTSRLRLSLEPWKALKNWRHQVSWEAEKRMGLHKDSFDTTYLLYPAPSELPSPCPQEKRKCTLEKLSPGRLGTQTHPGLTE